METVSTHGITAKDKIGYALGDAGGMLTFALLNAFLQMFYTDVLHISLSRIALLMLIVRIWDGVNDPIWGAFVDSRKPTKHGRFRPYIFWSSFPLAVGAVLLFTKLPGLTPNHYLAFAYITYLFYEMMYTFFNIPYGSIASVITDDEIERSSLSMWRSIGSGLGGLPAQVILPLVVYSTAVSGQKVLDAHKLFYSVIILAIVSLFAFFGNYKLTKERVPLTAKQISQKSEYNVFKTVKSLFKNKPFIVICFVSMFVIAFQLYSQTMYNYLFKNFYGNPGLYSVVTVCTYLPMFIFVPLMSRLIRRFGKKEICAFGAAFAAVISFLLYLLRFTPLMYNPYVFLALTFLSGAGQTFILLEVWALVMDVIDYQESVTLRREEGTCYAFYSFARKLGHTAAASGASLILAFIGYDVNRTDIGQSAEVLDKLYDATTLVPAILFTLTFVLLAYFYPLNKNNLTELHDKIEAARNAVEKV